MGSMSRRWVTRRRRILVGSSHRQRWVEPSALYRSNSTGVGCEDWVCAQVVSWWGNGSPRRRGPPIRENIRSRWQRNPCRAPFGECATFAALEATPEPQDRPLESRPSWLRIHAGLPRETGCGFCIWSFLQLTPRRVRECTSRCVRSQPAASSGTKRLTLESKTGCCFLRERAGQTRRSKGDPGAARRVQESRLSWRLSAIWSFFGRASEQST